MMKKRLIEYIKYLGISIRELERTAGFSNGYINSMTKGIGAEKLHQLCRAYPSLNPAWLLTGEGSMLNGKGDVAPHDTPTNFDIQLRAAYLRGKLDGYREAIELLHTQSNDIKKQKTV